MDKKTFDTFREIVYAKSGIALSEGKEALVCTRVGKRMRAIGMEDYKTYLQYVMNSENGDELVHLLDAISTNVTSFFREPSHFEFIDAAMREWIARGQKRFRFWSAASSTGEEPYSLAMTMLDGAGRNADVKILATDISTTALNGCRQGTYKQEKLAAVPPAFRQRFFTQHRRDQGLFFTVKPFLRRLLVFKRLNLSSPPFPMKGPLDAVFCRNVMIYFDNRIRKNLLEEVHRLLKPGGYLLVGHAESLTGMLSGMKVVRPSIYIKT